MGTKHWGQVKVTPRGQTGSDQLPSLFHVPPPSWRAIAGGIVAGVLFTFLPDVLNSLFVRLGLDTRVLADPLFKTLIFAVTFLVSYGFDQHQRLARAYQTFTQELELRTQQSVARHLDEAPRAALVRAVTSSEKTGSEIWHALDRMKSILSGQGLPLQPAAACLLDLHISKWEDMLGEIGTGIQLSEPEFYQVQEALLRMCDEFALIDRNVYKSEKQWSPTFRNRFIPALTAHVNGIGQRAGKATYYILTGDAKAPAADLGWMSDWFSDNGVPLAVVDVGSLSRAAATSAGDYCYFVYDGEVVIRQKPSPDWTVDNGWDAVLLSATSGIENLLVEMKSKARHADGSLSG